MNDFLNSTIPFDDAYWVLPGKLMAGEYPGRREEIDTRRRVQALINCGIRVCVDVTNPEELVSSYREILLEELGQRGIMGNYFHFPIYDFGIPSAAQMKRTLDVIDKSIEDGLPVYLHCRAGIGRTGLTVGCFLVRHGMSGEGALAEIKQLRKDVPSSWANSPESDAQTEFILKWSIGE